MTPANRSRVLSVQVSLASPKTAHVGAVDTDDIGEGLGRESAQLLAAVLNLFLDLWKSLPNMGQPNLRETLGYLSRIREELGKVVDLSDYLPPSEETPA